MLSKPLILVINYILQILLIITVQMSSSAPAPKETLSPFELAMLDRLHQPWAKPQKPIKHLYPRKGETICKEGVCKVKVEGCEDCQHAVPLKFERKSKTGYRRVWTWNKF